MLAFPPGLDFVAAFLGCLYAGAIAVPTPPPRRNPRSDRFLSIHKNCEPACILTTQDVLDRVRAYKKSNPELAALTWHLPETLEPSWDDKWQFPQVNRDTIAFLQYTSGSTGDPKGVIVDHGNLLHNQRLIQATFQQTEDVVTVGWLPMHHDMGLVGTLLHPLFLGGTLHLMSPMSFLQKPIRWLNLISEVRGTISTGPNFAYDLCTQRTTPEERAGLDLSSLETALNGAEPVRAGTIRKFIEVFEPHGFQPKALCPCYGMAEATLLISGIGPDESSLDHILERQPLGSEDSHSENQAPEVAADCPAELVHCGRPLPEMDVRIVHPETFTELSDGKIGEIWVSSRSVAKGYWNRPELTQEMFRAAIPREPHEGQNGKTARYFRTGDLGLKLQGYLYIAGRLKDVIILNGVNYYPHDLEATAEAADDCFVEGRGVAYRHEVAGNEEVAIVLEIKREFLRQLDDRVLMTVLTEIQQTWEISLEAIYLVRPGSVPITSSGKVQRQLTRQWIESGELAPLAHWQRRQPQCSPPPKDGSDTPQLEKIAGKESIKELERWMMGRLSEILEISPDQIDPREPFARYGFKSQHAVRFCTALEQHVGRIVEPVLAYDYPNIGELAKHLLSKNGQLPRPDQSGKTQPSKDSDEPIAIIGIGCRFPDADNPQEFWRLLASGQSALKPYPQHRWGDSADVAQPLPELGGFLDAIDEFDPQFFGISPREAEAMDPQQRLALEVCWQSLEDAGLPAEELANRQTGVFMGVSSSEYAHLQARLNLLPNGYNATGNSLAMTANRISYTLDLHGPSLVFDTACSSSLVAVHYASESLKRGDCDIAIAGGVNLIASPAITASLNQAGMLSPTGTSTAFAEQVDGYVRGEGCGILIAKRLSDAQRDNDNILAVIAGSAVNHDGRSNGLTAPNGLAQQRVIQHALANAHYSPKEIDYLEAHGTGTNLGDQIEFNALKHIFNHDRPNERPLWIGSAKSNIGHLEAAAGIAGLIKVCLALQQEELPAHYAPQSLAEQIREKSCLQVATKNTPWMPGEKKRIAGISSFGFGGTNAHLILEEAPARENLENEEPSHHILVLSTKSQPALQELAERFRDSLPGASLSSVCYSANTGRSQFAYRLALVAENQVQLRELLDQASEGALSNSYWMGRRRRPPRGLVFRRIRATA